MFYTLLRDHIVRRQSAWFGQDSIVYDGVLSQVQQMVNVGEGKVYGGELGFKYSGEYLWLQGFLNYMEGFDQERVRLRHASPLFGKLETGWKTRIGIS